jgi:4-amino-4-deoxy-L-arabinose transferase-like glycosyltransferase
MAALFFTAAFFAYALLLKGKKGSGVFLVVSLTLLFHTQYIYFFTLCVAFVLHAILFDRIRLKPLFLFLLIAVLINLPWMVWLSGMRYADRYGSQAANPQRIFSFFLNYCTLSFRLLLFPLLAVFPVLYMIFFRVNQGQWPRPEKNTVSHMSLLLFSIVVTICVLSVASPAPFFRYLAPLIPAMIIVVANIISIMVDVHWIAVVLATLFVILQWPIGKFIHEITHEFKGPMDGIVSYLNAHGSVNDTVAITYEDLPIKFYTKMRVVGGLTGENLAPALNARWVIFRKYTICEKDLAVRQYLLTNLNPAHYRKIVINFPDTPFENREDPAEHLFSTAVAEDRVVIYKRIF